MVYGVSRGSQQVFLVLPPAAGDPHSVGLHSMNDNHMPLPEGPELREIASPLPVWDLGDILFWVGVGVASLVFTVVLAAWLMRWAGRPRFPALPDEPGLRALRDLEKLRSRVGSVSGQQSAGHASGVLRSFLHRRHGMLASFATSRELAGLPGTEEPPAPPEVVPLIRCLEELDALRFAGDQSAVSEVPAVIDRATAILRGDSREAGGGSSERAAVTGAGTIEQPFHLVTVEKSGRMRKEAEDGVGENSEAEGGSVGVS